jgi:hypothetical protein
MALLALGFTVASQLGPTTVNVDCNKGGAVGRILSRLKPGDVVFLHGTCRENVVIQPEIPRITVDGQSKATINAPDEREPAIQILAREVTIKGLTVTGGSFGISVNRGATAVIDNNTIQNVARSGLRSPRTALPVSPTTPLNIVDDTGFSSLDDKVPVRTSSGIMGAMESGCCALQPPESSAIRSAGTGATDSPFSKPPTPMRPATSSMATASTGFAYQAIRE